MCRGWRREEQDDEPRALSDRGLMTVMLGLLAEGPASGYGLLQRLEERLGEVFSIGPGGVYPLLHLMEDRGYVTVAQDGGSRVHTVTEEGHQFLAERKEALEGFWQRVDQGRYRAEVFGLMQALRALAWELRNEEEEGALPPEKRQAIREAISNARRAIDEALAS